MWASSNQGSSSWRALLISENAPVPADRRVWNEGRALTAAGWEVTSSAPRARRATSRPTSVEGVEIHRYPLAPSAGGPPATCASTGRRCGGSAGSCAGWPAASGSTSCTPATRRTSCCSRRSSCAGTGSRFVFDHHDLVPELYRVALRRRRAVRSTASPLALERVASGSPTSSIATNESYRRIAVAARRQAPEDVFVVRNGPDLERFRPVAPDPALRARAKRT